MKLKQMEVGAFLKCNDFSWRGGEAHDKNSNLSRKLHPCVLFSLSADKISLKGYHYTTEGNISRNNQLLFYNFKQNQLKKQNYLPFENALNLLHYIPNIYIYVSIVSFRYSKSNTEKYISPKKPQGMNQTHLRHQKYFRVLVLVQKEAFLCATARLVLWEITCAKNHKEAWYIQICCCDWRRGKGSPPRSVVKYYGIMTSNVSTQHCLRC